MAEAQATGVSTSNKLRVARAVILSGWLGL